MHYFTSVLMYHLSVSLSETLWRNGVWCLSAKLALLLLYSVQLIKFICHSIQALSCCLLFASCLSSIVFFFSLSHSFSLGIGSLCVTYLICIIVMPFHARHPSQPHQHQQHNSSILLLLVHDLLFISLWWTDFTCILLLSPEYFFSCTVSCTDRRISWSCLINSSEHYLTYTR